jgi:hypothetical protein
MELHPSDALCLDEISMRHALRSVLYSIVLELPVAEITAPLDIEAARALRRHVLGGGELQHLTGWQHVIERDVGMEGELFGRAKLGIGGILRYSWQYSAKK